MIASMRLCIFQCRIGQRTSCISRRMTERSRSIASSLRCEFWMISDRMLIAFGTSFLNTWKANKMSFSMCRAVSRPASRDIHAVPAVRHQPQQLDEKSVLTFAW